MALPTFVRVLWSGRSVLLALGPLWRLLPFSVCWPAPEYVKGYVGWTQA